MSGESAETTCVSSPKCNAVIMQKLLLECEANISRYLTLLTVHLLNIDNTQYQVPTLQVDEWLIKKSVSDILQTKHPHPQPALPDALLGDPSYVHLMKSLLPAVVLQTKGAACHSGIDEEALYFIQICLT